jgi:hypothetical protein
MNEEARADERAIMISSADGFYWCAIDNRCQAQKRRLNSSMGVALHKAKLATLRSTFWEVSACLSFGAFPETGAKLKGKVDLKPCCCPFKRQSDALQKRAADIMMHRRLDRLDELNTPKLQCVLPVPVSSLEGYFRP